MHLLRTKFKNEIVSEFLPAKVTSNKVIIFCSGMPGYPDKTKSIELCEYFSKKGYWCFVPRYRGAWESEGELFLKSPHQDILDVMDELPKGFRDLWNGNKFVIKNPEIYIFGSSFGGPAGLLCSKDTRVKKVVCFSPVIDWREEKNTVEPISKLSKYVDEAFGNAYRVAKNGWKKIEKGEIYNPATEFEKIDGKKILIFHAKNDEVVSQKPLKSFVDKTSSGLILLKTGGHLGMSVMKPKFLKICLKFLKEK